MTAEDVKRLLGLVPHPREGGWFVRTYEADSWAAGEVEGEPTPGAEAPASQPSERDPRLKPWGTFGRGQEERRRRTATAIYYLLERGTFSEMHRLTSDEVFHFYAGDAVEQVQLSPDGGGRRVVIGRELAAGERPQVMVRRGVWQGARLVEGGAWALLGCTVSPGFEFEDYESGRVEELVRGWPEWEGMVRGLCRE